MNLPDEILLSWPQLRFANTCQPISGGLSSSRVWKIAVAEQEFALKSIPVDSIRRERLEQIHAFQSMLSRANAPVAKLQPSKFDQTITHAAGSFWELSSWLPGAPIELCAVTLGHGRSAIEALANLHSISRQNLTQPGLTPAIVDRIQLIERYHNRTADWSTVLNQCTIELRELAARTRVIFTRESSALQFELKSFANSSELFWIMRDIHRQHVLFQGSQVSGLIDFGASRIDHPVSDLVRMLGTVFPFSVDIRHSLVEYYGELIGSIVDLKLFKAIDHASTLLSAMQWLQWLVVEQQQFPVENELLLTRWRQLLMRLELNQW